MKPIAITLALLLATGGLVYLSWSSARARDPEPRTSTAPSTPHESERESVALEPQARLAVEPEKSLGRALAEYWDSEWPALEARYAGIDLGASLAASAWKPWEEVEAEVQAAARSIHERDREFLRGVFLSRFEETDGFLPQLGLSEENEAERLPMLQAAVADVDAELEALSRRYMAQLDLAVERALARGPEKSPLVDLRDRDPDLRAQEKDTATFREIQVEKGGWYVAYGLRRADCPELVEIEKEQQELVQRRLAQLRSRAKELVRADR